MNNVINYRTLYTGIFANRSNRSKRTNKNLQIKNVLTLDFFLIIQKIIKLLLWIFLTIIRYLLGTFWDYSTPGAKIQHFLV